MDGAIPAKKNWLLTPEGFDCFLSRLNPDRDRAGEEYEMLRRSLLTFFRHRGALSPEDLADETFNRVIKRLSEKLEVEHIPSYLLAVARNIWREYQRGPELKQVEIHDGALPPQPRNLPAELEQGALTEVRLTCLQKCLRLMDAGDKFLIWRFHTAERTVRIASRKELARTLEISDNALRIRAYKIKRKLKTCLNRCLEQAAGGNESAFSSVDE